MNILIAIVVIGGLFYAGYAQGEHVGYEKCEKENMKNEI